MVVRDLACVELLGVSFLFGVNDGFCGIGMDFRCWLQVQKTYIDV